MSSLSTTSQAEPAEQAFDFEQHRTRSIEQYREVRKKYEDFSDAVRKIIEASLLNGAVNYHEIEARAKDIDSFGKKATKPSEDAPESPKYPDPLAQITDLAGVRVITFFPKTLDAVDEIISNEFIVEEKTDKSEELEKEGTFGYKSIHYLVKMKPERLVHPEYANFTDLIAEVQSRTILQHAWAEMEHDIQYKSADVIPISIKRKFVVLAGMLEMADREFQAIQDEDEELRSLARTNVEEGKLEDVEITPDALKSYLDKKLGADGRITAFSYEFLARNLRKMGFTNFRQINEAIEGFDSDNISQILWYVRQGQIRRFEETLLAGMGENFASLHPWGKHEWFIAACKRKLERLNASGVETRGYIPF
ncbi:MAG TPA: hypothetical protein VGO50_21285 [Pyrinomonadaceae bacterium]|jgi:ppGpp synthetase/RelA/SpoT-type nucleotidyltranferase|nr:hypothetical protein [Pyrinomonadaceae bacterium]